jgi:hypothetical protein
MNRIAAMNDEPLTWKVARVRGEMLELGSAVRQLRQNGLDSASAQLLLTRKRAELEDPDETGIRGGTSVQVNNFACASS